MLNRCIDLASQLQNRKQRIASIITDKKGRILSFGVNSYTKSHPKMAHYSSKFNDFNKIYLHSEMDSLVRLSRQGHSIYVARVDKKGNPLPCKPCRICALALKDAKIFNIITT
jgi:deoxycytidylate deaminase